MKRFKVSYLFYTLGFGFDPDTIPEEIIEAENEDKARYLYKIKYFPEYKNESFEDWMKRDKYERIRGISIKEDINGMVKHSVNIK